MRSSAPRLLGVKKQEARGSGVGDRDCGALITRPLGSIEPLFLFIFHMPLGGGVMLHTQIWPGLNGSCEAPWAAPAPRRDLSAGKVLFF